MTGPFKACRNRAKMNFTGISSISQEKRRNREFPEFQTDPKHLELPAMEMNY
jgi:hypothetical protein